MPTEKPQISVILEWENALLSELRRARAMLRQLRQQIRQQSQTFEFIVLFNPEQIRRELISSELEAAFSGDDLINYRIEPAPGLHYYDLKNFGATLAAGEIIVFVDSDVIPEDGWLSNILQPLLADNTIKVVAGTSYIDPENFFSKAFALSWIFPLRSRHNHIDATAKSFHANNLALRKEFFLANPFPAMPDGVTRGACGQLAAKIKSQGETIYRQHPARVSHPPPNGLVHTVVRGLAEGRDAVFKMKPANKLVLFGQVVLKFIRRIFNRALFRTVRNHKLVGMPLWQVPGAVLLMTAYYLIAMAGGIMAVLFPGYMAKSCRI